MQTRHWLFAFFTAFAVVPTGVLLLAIILGLEPGAAYRDVSRLISVLPKLHLVAVLSLPPLLVGGIILEIALRLSRAGWATAIVGGASVSLLAFRIVLGTFPFTIFGWVMLALLGMIYAGIFWLTLRNQVPSAFTD